MNPFTWLRQWWRGRCFKNEVRRSKGNMTFVEYNKLADRYHPPIPNLGFIPQPTPNYWNTIPDQQEVMQRHNVDENGMLRQPTPEPDSVCRLWDNNGIWEITLSSTRLEDEEGSDWLGNFTMSQSDFKRLCNHKNQEAIQKFLAGLDKVDTTNHKRVDRNTWMEGVRHED